ncbi:MAG: hypothetical protein ACI4QW_04490, partial [Clostridia bacterium]
MDDIRNNQQEPEQKKEWYSDDFEQSVKNAVPKARAMSVYTPRVKRSRLFFRQPVVAAVISSLVTCGICLGAFAFTMNRDSAALPAPVSQSAGET